MRGRIIPGSENSANNNNKKTWENTGLIFLPQKWYMFIVRRQTWIMVRKTKKFNLKPHHSIPPHFSICSFTYKIIQNGIILNISASCFLHNILAWISFHASSEYTLERLKTTGIPEFKGKYSPSLTDLPLSSQFQFDLFFVFFQDFSCVHMRTKRYGYNLCQ